MTIREYIQGKLSAWGNFSESDLAAWNGTSLDAEYSSENAKEVGAALCEMIGERILSPRVSNVSESGFSISWNFDNIGKYYLWLCKKYGVTPDTDIVTMSGMSTITNKSDMW